MPIPRLSVDAITEPLPQSVALVPLTDQHLTAIKRDAQLNDESIGVIFRVVESATKLTADALQGLGPESRKFHQQWDLLRVKHGKLWRAFIASEGTTSHIQLLVPLSLRQNILAELHGGPLGGHLGEDKMCSRV